MNNYEKKAVQELRVWQRKMSKKPSFASRISKGLQNKVNTLIPEKAQKVITEAIKNMVKGVLSGSKFITRKPLANTCLEERERLVKEKIDFYKKAAAVSGAGTGAGGLLVGLADFPILLSLKIKFLFDTASLYGFDVRNYKERLYILYVFQLAFSSQENRVEVYKQVLDWDNYIKQLPLNVDSFDWRTFQQEYRDYIDLAKMLQFIPGIGAVVGAYANYQLIDKLGETAINAYRLRLFNVK
ncbi:EcsC family protein [Clostridium ganghwense]|uniref:EcsC family protein n=1 Tax=Clostridium ganghwense TaxID=312089 RepID=A0ABT4CU21_9CLOT|nr:EcsC family protein [Clostridium ganghwense]MCY6372570.1 EcsC family protein [Clostridium ganghwense]